MTAAEEGVLLLCCRLGEQEEKPLTMAQFRELGLRVRASEPNGNRLDELTQRDLLRLGYDPQQAERILRLLNRQSQLVSYLKQAERHGIVPVTRVSAAYPGRIRQKQQLSCPPVLFARGDLSLLSLPCVSVIGSRQLRPENQAFAKQAGRLAAAEQLVLVSGNAPGADQTAQQACLDAGGSCIVFVADCLLDHPAQEHILYISEDGYKLPFSPARALHRNRLIHTQGDRTIAVQCTYGKGGTWEGCLDNLRHRWSKLFVFDDGSAGCQALIERGATGITDFTTITGLQQAQISLF